MTNAGAQCNFLKVSVAMKTALQASGRSERFAPDQILFREDDRNYGVFLVVKGKVRMSVRGLPKLDRLFSIDSLLGVPSTFTGHDYSLTAVALVQTETLHVGQEEFLQLMRERSDLCREATEMLGREVTFIQAALAERRKQAAAKKMSPVEIGVLS